MKENDPKRMDMQLQCMAYVHAHMQNLRAYRHAQVMFQ